MVIAVVKLEIHLFANITGSRESRDLVGVINST